MTEQDPQGSSLHFEVLPTIITVLWRSPSFIAMMVALVGERCWMGFAGCAGEVWRGMYPAVCHLQSLAQGPAPLTVPITICMVWRVGVGVLREGLGVGAGIHMDTHLRTQTHTQIRLFSCILVLWCVLQWCMVLQCVRYGCGVIGSIVKCRVAVLGFSFLEVPHIVSLYIYTHTHIHTVGCN